MRRGEDKGTGLASLNANLRCSRTASFRVPAKAGDSGGLKLDVGSATGPTRSKVTLKGHTSVANFGSAPRASLKGTIADGLTSQVRACTTIGGYTLVTSAYTTSLSSSSI